MSSSIAMSLLKYFQPSSTLPKPEGRLSTVVPSSSIAAANKEVKQVLDKTDKPESKRGAYEHFTPEEKAQIGKRAAEYGVTASLRYFSVQRQPPKPPGRRGSHERWSLQCRCSSGRLLQSR